MMEDWTKLTPTQWYMRGQVIGEQPRLDERPWRGAGFGRLGVAVFWMLVGAAAMCWVIR